VALGQRATVDGHPDRRAVVTRLGLQPPGGADEAVDEHGRHADPVDRHHLVAVLVGDDPGAVRVADEDVVEVAQEADRDRRVGIRAGSVGEVEELPAGLVAEADGLSAVGEALRGGGEPRQPRPGLGVGDRGRAERSEVPGEQRRVVDAGVVELVAQPRFDREVVRGPAAAPQAARRRVHERDEDADRPAEPLGGRPGERVREVAPDRAGQAGLLRQALAGVARERVEVEPVHGPAERTAEVAVDDRLHRRAQRQGVAGADEVDRAAHQQDPHDAPLLQRAREVLGVEGREAVGQRDVR
jgi:hypothetical protein